LHRGSSPADTWGPGSDMDRSNTGASVAAGPSVLCGAAKHARPGVGEKHHSGDKLKLGAVRSHGFGSRGWEHRKRGDARRRASDPRAEKLGLEDVNMRKAGMPGEICTCTSTGMASIPENAKVRTRAITAAELRAFIPAACVERMNVRIMRLPGGSVQQGNRVRKPSSSPGSNTWILVSALWAGGADGLAGCLFFEFAESASRQCQAA
jgi:hypothetical protein